MQLNHHCFPLKPFQFTTVLSSVTCDDVKPTIVHCIRHSLFSARTAQGQPSCSRNSLILTVWCAMSSYRPDRVLLVIYTCHFCRGCVMRFGGSDAKFGRQGQWFLHHDKAPNHTSLVVSSPSHRTLRISPRVTPHSSVLAPSDTALSGSRPE
jgi:hypothetical protein